MSYMPLAHCGIKVFHGKARGYRAREFGRARFSCIFCFSEQSLAATDPSSGFKFQFTQATVANHAVGMPMGPKAKRVNELVCECGGDRSAVIEKRRAERKVVCWPCGSPRTREEQMEEVEEKHREWLRKRQSRGSPA